MRWAGRLSPLAAGYAVFEGWHSACVYLFGFTGIEFVADLTTISPWWPATIIFLGVFATVQFASKRSLEKRLSAKLSIGTPVAVHVPKESQNPNSVTFKVRVFNKSSENIEACQVRLIEMINRKNAHNAEEGRAFKRSLDSPADILNQPHDLSFNIPPGGWEDVDLVQVDYRRPTPTIRMLYALQGIRDMNVLVWIPYDLCPHTIRIQASANNCSTPEKKTLVVSGRDDDRHVQLTEI